MADEKKIDHDPDNLENLSPEELQERIRQEKKNAKRSLRFAFTALIAIIAVCIAWFVNNTQVRVNGIQISAEDDQQFEIASVGERQKVEVEYLKDAESKNILSDGTAEQKYNCYIDVDNGDSKDVYQTQTYYTGRSGVAWRMEGQKNLAPGSGGKLEFYLIPKKTGLKSVTVKLNLKGYALKDEKAELISDNKIQNLINGHILLFRHHNDEYGYYDWLGEESTLTLKAPKSSEEGFVKNIPYKVTLYWKWPQYFRNYIYTQTTTYGDLFTDEMINSQEYNTEYQKFINFVNAQRTITNSKLFYMQDGNETLISGDISNQMPENVLNTYSSYYNQADEYIGKNTQYIYIQIEISDVR